MKKDILLFDLDGTLTDPQEGITKSLQSALEYFGITVLDRQQLCRFIGPPLKSGFKEFYGFDDQKADLAVTIYRQRYSQCGIFECILYPGIKSLLEKLKEQGKTICLATSKPVVYAKRILEYFNIDRFFSFVGGSELSGERTEKDQVIEYVLQNIGCTFKPGVLMVGDRKHDLMGAKQNSIDCAGVLYGYGGLEELASHNPVFLAETVEKLADFLCTL